MKTVVNNQRRKFLQQTALATVAASYPSFLKAANLKAINTASADFHPDVEIELSLNVAKIAILKGDKTNVWKVRGKVLKGSPDSVKNMAGSYLAPTIHLHKGQKVRIYLKNNLPVQSILHWHGLHVPSKMDGNPMYAINHGETYIYEFEILNRAGTYWYHSHAHGVTAKQVYSGMAGLFIVSDDEEQALNLPKGKYDVPIVIQDRSFDRKNQLKYSNHMMQKMQGFLGDQIMINGQPNYTLEVENRSYRLRLLNGSNSRIYKLAWDDGSPITVIGTDGGLIDKPETMPYVMLAPAERRELWVDFSKKPVGTELTLRSVPFEGASMHGGMGGMMSRGNLPAGGDYPILKVKVTSKANSNDSLPTRLTPITRLKMADSANSKNPRTIRLSMGRMSALLNNRSYKMNDIRSDEVIPVNTLQLMEFDNGFSGSGGGMGMMNMAMPHPMHLHGEQFQIIKREVNPRFKTTHDTISKGLVDSGWKDTALVMPGEKVTFLKPFNDFKGLFMYHCHNLEHEDLGMMRDYLVK